MTVTKSFQRGLSHHIPPKSTINSHEKRGLGFELFKYFNMSINKRMSLYDKIQKQYYESN